MIRTLTINTNLYGMIETYKQDVQRKAWIFYMVGGSKVIVPFHTIKYWDCANDFDITLYKGMIPTFIYAD